MENQTFSIIVPVYNVEQYLENCINSVLNQSFRNFQLILVMMEVKILLERYVIGSLKR